MPTKWRKQFLSVAGLKISFNLVDPVDFVLQNKRVIRASNGSVCGVLTRKPDRTGAVKRFGGDERNAVGHLFRSYRIIELQDALHKVKVLSGLLPICASCKKIRDGNGYWSQIEAYIQAHSEAEFSHSICPDCINSLYSDIYINSEDE
jgi:hypothetical protein